MPGYVLKSVADRDLVEACRATMRGEPFLYPGAVTAADPDFLDRARHGEVVPERPLTPREHEVGQADRRELQHQDIARELGISEKTVERHRANIPDKLGINDAQS